MEDSHGQRHHDEHAGAGAPRQTIASVYLGRDTSHKSSRLPESRLSARRARGSNESAPAEMGRTPIDNSAHRSKRQKLNTLTRSFDVTKPSNPSNAGQATTADLLGQSKRTNVSGLIQGASAAFASGRKTVGVPLISTVFQPISVHAQQTTMDTLDSSSARTSIDSVKLSGTHGFTSYQRLSSTAPKTSGFSASPPWANDLKQPSLDHRDSVVAQDELKEHTTESGCVSDESSVNGVCQSTAAEPSDRRRQSAIPQDEKSLSAKSTTEMITDTRMLNGVLRAVHVSRQTSIQSQMPTTANNQQTSLHLIDDDDPQLDTSEAKSIDCPTHYGDQEILRTGQPTRSRKQNIRDVSEHEDYGGTLLSAAERRALVQLEANKKESKVPIIRKPFLAPILDRSPILGASNDTMLRTCFRLGEVINAGSQAARTQTNVILEVYARVMASWREPQSRRQHFTFCDLYHNRPPHLSGTFELWDQSALWDLDSRHFLGAKEAIKCRMIARLKRDTQSWKIEVLSIWPATWEDIEYVAGIYGTRGRK